MRIRSLALVLCIVALVGCDDVPVVGGGPADVAGTWNYEAEFSETGCTATAELEFSQSGEAISGGVRDLVVDCGEEGDTEIQSGISSTDLSGSEIAFELIDFFHSGSVDGDRMSGQASGGPFEFQSGPTRVTTLEGEATWTATRR